MCVKAGGIARVLDGGDKGKRQSRDLLSPLDSADFKSRDPSLEKSK